MKFLFGCLLYFLISLPIMAEKLQIPLQKFTASPMLTLQCVSDEKGIEIPIGETEESGTITGSSSGGEKIEIGREGSATGMEKESGGGPEPGRESQLVETTPGSLLTIIRGGSTVEIKMTSGLKITTGASQGLCTREPTNTGQSKSSSKDIDMATLRIT